MKQTFDCGCRRLPSLCFCLQVWQENELPDVQPAEWDCRNPGGCGSELRVFTGFQDALRLWGERRLGGWIRAE